LLWGSKNFQRRPIEAVIGSEVAQKTGLKIVGKLKEPIDWQKVTDVSFLPQDLQARTH